MFGQKAVSKSGTGLIKSHLLQFCRTTTIRGVPRIVNAKSGPIRFLWSFFVLILFIGCMVCTIYMINQFLAYDVLHPPRILQDQLSPFPSITLCNLRPISNIGFETLSQNNHRPPREFAIHVNMASHMHFNVAQNKSDEYALLTSTMSLSGYLENMHNISVSDLGHNYTEMILFCRLSYLSGSRHSTNNCKSKGKWRRFTHSQYLNCYTFDIDDEFLTSAKSLEMHINIDEHNKSRSCQDCFTFDIKSQLSGALLVVHTPSTFPDTIQESINLAPGTLTEVKLKVVKNNQLEPPYGLCSKRVPKTITMYDREFAYSKHACRQMTIQQEMNDKCKCTALEYPILDKKLRFCSELSLFVENDICELERQNLTYPTKCNEQLDRTLEMTQCKVQVMSNYLNDVVKGCYSPCSFYSYENDRSTSVWPTKSWQINMIMQEQDGKYTRGHPQYAEARRYLKSKNESDREKGFDIVNRGSVFERNLIAVIVNKPNSNLHVVEGKEVLSLTSFLSQVGGLFSIWIGLTMINIVELIELILNCVSVLRGVRPANDSPRASCTEENTPLNKNKSRNRKGGKRSSRNNNIHNNNNYSASYPSFRDIHYFQSPSSPADSPNIAIASKTRPYVNVQKEFL